MDLNNREPEAARLYPCSTVVLRREITMLRSGPPAPQCEPRVEEPESLRRDLLLRNAGVWSVWRGYSSDLEDPKLFPALLQGLGSLVAQSKLHKPKCLPCKRD